ncbi:aconitate hydratase AcnA [Rhodococcus sp. T2V]|uniref:aconitate hydratase AcnA n=1 Tax=Rhodococcus sp. T2V TaxID=3034164 RepID=UPI0023E34363|nr:aconitate hydratase AcnA [Rhodococcus sp. T2V]MDF3312045.1 aconitate hydratase AcnA [Rhodococcus sp. T2V]
MTHATLPCGASYRPLSGFGDLETLPYSLRALLDNLASHESGAAEQVVAGTRHHTHAVLGFRPARVLLQDLTGVPCLADLAALREAVTRRIDATSTLEPVIPIQLVVDHSISVDHAGVAAALASNVELEYHRNGERYTFLRWAQTAFDKLEIVPPNKGIVHQVNLEYLSEVVTIRNGRAQLDSCVGTDSHTTMVNALGVLGWGVGGIEAISTALGEPLEMGAPEVVGVRLSGQLAAGVTATDLVLSLTDTLRGHGVVGKFVEFCGPGLPGLSLETRATIANMAPEYGSTCAYFPIDAETLRYLRLSGRSNAQVRLVEEYARAQQHWHDPSTTPTYSQLIAIDLSAISASIAGPSRPDQRILLGDAKSSLATALSTDTAQGTPDPAPTADGSLDQLHDGAIIIAAITSCTNTSNPSVMVAAGLLARNAAARGLRAKSWVKTSLAPGSAVVTDYLRRADLLSSLEELGFAVVGYGCTTCSGNSGPLPRDVTDTVAARNLSVAAVLSGNRNFEGRIHPAVKLGYLASPPLVVAYAIAGSMNIDLTSDPLGVDAEGRPVYLADIWPTDDDIADVIGAVVRTELYRHRAADLFVGDERWAKISHPSGPLFTFDDTSTYIRRPPFLDNVAVDARSVDDIIEARALAVFGDGVTTDHISPAGVIDAHSPAADLLREWGVQESDLGSYGSRRGNHEVMVRGTFANARLQNKLVPGTDGGFTRILPEGDVVDIFDASERYRAAGTPLVIIAGKSYGIGSSRDWAAKGTRLLGVRAVIAESFERIHRSNLVAMGIIPLQFIDGDNLDSLTLRGDEPISVLGLTALDDDVIPSHVEVRAGDVVFRVRMRVDSRRELLYIRNGGVLPTIFRRVADSGEVSVDRIQLRVPTPVRAGTHPTP